MAGQAVWNFRLKAKKYFLRNYFYRAIIWFTQRSNLVTSVSLLTSPRCDLHIENIWQISKVYVRLRILFYSRTLSRTVQAFTKEREASSRNFTPRLLPVRDGVFVPIFISRFGNECHHKCVVYSRIFIWKTVGGIIFGTALKYPDRNWIRNVASLIFS